jgi:hypothetical protein
MYARRDSGWSAPRRIAAAPHGVNCQSLAVGPDDRVHVVYTGDIGNGNLHVFYLHSDGDSWTTPIDISSGAPASTYSPSIAVDSSNILYAVWEQEWPLVQRELMLSVYDGVWHTPINLTLDSVHGAYSPHLGVPPGRGRVDLCWVGTTTERTYPVYYMRLAAVRADVAEPSCGDRCHSGIAAGPTVFHERLRLTIPPGARGPVSVLDAAGRLVRVLSPTARAGRVIEWDSRDDRGLVARKGVYFIRTGEGLGGTRTKVVKL